MTPRWLNTDGRRWPAIAALAVGAGVIAEAIGSSNTPAFLFLNPIIPLLYTLLYGPPVLLLREGWVRGRVGWPGVALAGLAFAALNEGVVANVWFKAGALDFSASAAGRAEGVNWTLVAGLIVFHTFVSLCIPIVMAQLTFERIANQPWLRRRGIIVCVVLSCFIGITSVLPKDGHAVDDAGRRALALLLVAVAAAAAWVMPAWRPARRLRAASVSRRRVYWGAVGLAVTFGLLFFGLTATAPRLVPVGMAALYLTIGLILARWITARDWSRRHTLMFVAGALTPSMLVSLVRVLWLQPVVTGLFVWLLVRLDRRWRGEATWSQPDASQRFS